VVVALHTRSPQRVKTRIYRIATLTPAFTSISRPQQGGFIATLCAKSGREQVQHTNALLDDLVGKREQLIRHGEGERLGSLEINRQLKLGRLHDR
jgi:hypothetical protein